MSDAEQVRESDTDQGIQLSFWEQCEEERRRRGPTLTDAQRDGFLDAVMNS